MLLLISLFFILISCTPKLTVVDDKGQRLPTISHEVRDLRGRFHCNFYYVEIEEGKDKDQTPILKPINYLKLYQNEQKLQYKTNKVVMILEVSNPQKVEYKLIEDKKITSIENYKKVEKRSFNTVAESTQEYRKYVFELPAKNFQKVDYELKLFVGNEFVFTFGELIYLPN